MMSFSRTLCAGLAGLAVAAAAVAPAAAGSARKHRPHHHQYYQYRAAPAPMFHDNVGSLAQDRFGHSYNRFSGQRYFQCMMDEGYGRVRPCDAGGRT
jgi:hypothetical protein